MARYYLDDHGLETYNELIKKKISELVNFEVKVVDSLPQTGEEHILYLVPNALNPNIHDEYLWIQDKWELIGSTEIDLSDYYTKSEVDASLSLKADKSELEDYATKSFVNSSLSNYYTKNEVDSSLSLKQDIINDLSDIRTGAALGATALQSFTETDPTVPAWAKESTKPSYTANEVGALPDDTFIPTNISDLTDDINIVTSEHVSSVSTSPLYVVSRTPIIDKTSDTSITFNIDPNVMYMFGTRTDLTINFVAGESDVVNEYMFLFTSGNVATTLNLPNTVVWLKDPDIQTNKKYLVSIENNLGIIGEWNNE